MAGELFCRGLFPYAAALAPRVEVKPQDRVIWFRRPHIGYMSGEIYTHGSTLHSKIPEARRAGWAVIMVDSVGNLLSAAYGPLPFYEGPNQSIAEAEDFAIHMIPSLCFGKLRIHCDRKGAVDCLLKGKEYATGSKRHRAHLWNPFFACFDADSYEATWVPGHPTQQQVENDFCSWVDREALGHADKLAKAGAALHKIDSADLGLLVACHTIQTMALRHAAELEARANSLKVFDHDPLVYKPVQPSLVIEPEAEDNDVEELCTVGFVNKGSLSKGINFNVLGHAIVEFDSLPADAKGSSTSLILICTCCAAYSQALVFRGDGLGGNCKGANHKGRIAQQERLAKCVHPSGRCRDTLANPHFPTGPRLKALLNLRDKHELNLHGDEDGRPESVSLAVESSHVNLAHFNSCYAPRNLVLRAHGIDEAEVDSWSQWGLTVHAGRQRRLDLEAEEHP